MDALWNEITHALLRAAPEDGLFATPVSGVHCIRISTIGRRTKERWRACLSIVVQGSKEVVLGRETHHLTRARFAATPVDLPVTSRVSSAAYEQPFLCLLIDMDPRSLVESAVQAELGDREPRDIHPGSVFVGELEENMTRALHRLVALFQAPKDAPAVGPLVVKELLYYLMRGPVGSAVYQFVRAGSKLHRISQAISALCSELSCEVDLDELAATAGMSRSVFFKMFKEVTTASPIQYQKRLRLFEARRLMVEVGETAERAAYAVGYKSSSQFSREYSRMFGSPPFRDATTLRNGGAPRGAARMVDREA